MQILHLDSSILSDTSGSRALTAGIVEQLRRENPRATVIYRDLVAEAIPHLDGPIAAGFRDIGIKQTDPNTLAEHVRSRALTDELLASDVLVVGAPMYNFSVATQLKAWIDRVVQPGRSFRYTEAGPVGLAGGKRVIVAWTRGGVYTSGAAAAMDFQEPYLKTLFGFIGITSVHFVRAERMSKGADARNQAMEAAHASVRAVVEQAMVV